MGWGGMEKLGKDYGNAVDDTLKHRIYQYENPRE
jgi:hypothetical protein